VTGVQTCALPIYTPFDYRYIIRGILLIFRKLDCEKYSLNVYKLTLR